MHPENFPAEHAQLLNLPKRMRDLPQWAVCYEDKVPIDPKNLQAASSTDPSTWGTFEQAVEALQKGPKHVGFMLSPGDEFCIVDLDNKLDDPAPQEELERFESMIQTFDTYTEWSASGRGYHLILQGSVPKGARRGHVEVYSSARFMICTGNVHLDRPIREGGEMLANMYSQLAPRSSSIELDEDAEEELGDREIHDRAMHAKNGEKYDKLTRSAESWREVIKENGEPYESQSEADMALIAIYAFYSKSNEQCRRLFRMSPLGQRDKAQRPDYLDRMLKPVRARQAEAAQRDAARSSTQHARGSSKSGNTVFDHIGSIELLPPQWLVRDWLATPTTAAIIGPSNTGKTFLALDWALCIATGRPWMGHPVQQGTVLYIPGEGRSGLIRRVAAWCEHHGEDLKAIPLYISRRMPNLSELAGADEILRADVMRGVEKVETVYGQRPALIVIDTVARALHGESDNDAKPIGTLIACMDQLRDELGATVLAIHHTGHSDPTRARGHSSLPAAMDSWYLLLRNACGMLLTSEREKDWKKPDPHRFMLTSVPLKIGEEDSASCVLTDSAWSGAQPEQSMNDKKEQAFDLLRQSKSQRAVAEAVGVNKNTVNKWAQELKEKQEQEEE